MLRAAVSTKCVPLFSFFFSLLPLRFLPCSGMRLGAGPEAPRHRCFVALTNYSSTLASLMCCFVLFFFFLLPSLFSGEKTKFFLFSYWTGRLEWWPAPRNTRTGETRAPFPRAHWANAPTFTGERLLHAREPRAPLIFFFFLILAVENVDDSNCVPVSCRPGMLL